MRASRWSSRPTSPGSTSIPKSAMSPSFQGLRLSARQPIDLIGQIQVVLSQAAGTVSGENEANVPPADVHVRMVVTILRDLGNLADELDRGGERGAGDRALDLVAVALPVIVRAQPVVDDALIQQFGHEWQDVTRVIGRFGRAVRACSAGDPRGRELAGSRIRRRWWRA